MSKSIIRAGLIVQLIDALTGNPISVEGRKVRLILEKARVPLEKGNGYYVFLHPIQPGVRLFVSAYGYKEQELRLSNDSLSEEIMKIYLEPGKQYPISGSCFCLFGKAKPGTELILIRHPDGSMGLREDYKAGESGMFLFSRSGKIPMKVRFQIREQEHKEFLSFQEPGNVSGQYRLEVPLKGDYHARKAGFYLVKQVVTDEQGEFFCYWHRDKEEKRVLTCEVWTSEDEKTAVFELEAGKRIKL